MEEGLEETIQGDRSKVPGGRLAVNERKGATSSEVEGEESILMCM